MSQSKERTKILPLTSLRFFAAAAVVVYHLSPYVFWLHQPNLLGRSVALGFVSVSFFFVLSGFVLATSYARSEASFNLKGFLVARFARIYPGFCAWLLFETPHFVYTNIRVMHHRAQEIFLLWLGSFFALHGWLTRFGFMDAPCWSISDEFFFYLLFPFVAFRLWRMKSQWLGVVCVLLYLLGNAFVYYCFRHGAPHYELDFNPLTHLPDFFLGIALARFRDRIERRPAWSARVRRFAPALALLAVLVFFAIPAFSLGIPLTLMQHSALFPIYAAIILAFASGNALIEKIFAVPLLVLLGEASFALYLLHIPVAAVLRVPLERQPILMPFVFFGICVGLSIVSFHFLETPARRWIIRRFHSRDRESIAVQTLAQ